IGGNTDHENGLEEADDSDESNNDSDESNNDSDESNPVLTEMPASGLEVRNVETGENTFRLLGKGEGCWAISPNGKLLVTCGDGRPIIWEGASLKEIRSLDLDGYEMEVNCAAFAPDSKRLVTG